MATNAERQARYRAERLKNGERELKGLYVPEHLHGHIKEMIRGLLVRLDDDSLEEITIIYKRT
jgi:hypothetical protein